MNNPFKPGDWVKVIVGQGMALVKGESKKVRKVMGPFVYFFPNKHGGWCWDRFELIEPSPPTDTEIIL